MKPSSSISQKLTWGFSGFILGACLCLFISNLFSFSDKIYRSLDLFTRILQYIETDYVTAVDEKKLIQGAIEGLLNTLDPYTNYLTPEVYKELQMDTSGKFGGIGIEVTKKENQLTVVTAIEGSPADRAGIRAGDKIIKINGIITKGSNLAEISQKIRGPRKTKLDLTIQREGWSKPKDIVVIRETINTNSVKAEFLDNSIGYFRISHFQENTRDDLVKAITNLEKKNGKLKGMILDLRRNPGGLLEQAVEVSDLFIREGLIVSTEGRALKREEKRASGKGPYLDIPLAVLVNQESASAAEILAGALQDHKRGHLIGTQTYGKGSVQTVINLENGAGLKMTIAHYFTPSGRLIHGKGITPDEVVYLSRTPESSAAEDDEEFSKKSDLQREAALAYLKKIIF